MADLWKVVRDVATITGSEGIVYIGGVAIYLHTTKTSMPPETTHDADAAVSIVGWSSLRDRYEAETNQRLSKSQITVDDVEVDLYVQHKSRLRFDYVELAQYASERRNFRIASRGHLLLLKLDAFRDRGSSQKGAKDRRDLAKLLVMLASTKGDDFDLVLGSVTDADLVLLDQVVRSSAFMEITKRNAKTASSLRTKAESFVKRMRDAR